MSEYFPKPKYLEANVKVELDLSNCAKKADLKIVTGVDTSDFAKMTDAKSVFLAKSDVYKLDIDKLITQNNTKINEIEKKITDHNHTKYIITQ